MEKSVGTLIRELYALRWEDWQEQQLKVQRSFSRVARVGRLIKGTKTDRSRSVFLLSVAVDALRRQKQTQRLMRVKAGATWQDTGYIFTTALGKPVNETDTRHAFLCILGVAGLPPMRPYDLRHSAASLYLALGVSGKDVQSLLGHSNIQLTFDTYGHSFPAVQAEAMQKLDDLLRGQR